MKGDLREANQGKTGKHYSLVQSRFNRNSNCAEEIAFAYTTV
jgi:hypothetical protein